MLFILFLILLYFSFIYSDCFYHNISKPYGYIQSPHLKYIYSREYCFWILELGYYNVLEIRIEYSNLAVGDYINIHDGATLSSPILIKLYGTSGFRKITTSTGSAFIRYQKQSIGHLSTFNITYQIKGVCIPEIQESCQETELSCYDIRHEKCNNIWNCPITGRDEENCPICKAQQLNSNKILFPCSDLPNSHCYNREQRCDGFANCETSADEMIEVVPENKHMQEALLFLFHLKKNASDTHKLMMEAYGNHTLAERTCPNLFNRFKFGNFDLNDKPHGHQQKKFEDHELQVFLDEDDAQTQIQLEASLNTYCEPLQCGAHNKTFLCKTFPTRCISEVMKCDGVITCRDGSDEQNCDFVLPYYNSSHIRIILVSSVSIILCLLMVVLSFVCIRRLRKIRNVSTRSLARRTGLVSQDDSSIQQLINEQMRRGPPPPNYNYALCHSRPFRSVVDLEKIIRSHSKLMGKKTRRIINSCQHSNNIPQDISQSNDVYSNLAFESDVQLLIPDMDVEITNDNNQVSDVQMIDPCTEDGYTHLSR